MKSVADLIAKFLVGFLTNKEKDSFLVRLGVKLTLASYGLTGFFGDIVGWFFRSAVGFLVMEGKFAIDLTLDSLREGMLIAEFKEHAQAAYEKATARVYTEEEKLAIRKEYLDIVDRFTSLNPGLPNHP